MKLRTFSIFPYIIAMVAITFWIYFARLIFGLGYGWETLAFVFFAPPFLLLQALAVVSLYRSHKLAPTIAPNTLQVRLFIAAMVTGFFLGLTSPYISDASPEMSILFREASVATVYAIPLILFTIYIGLLIAITVTSARVARRSK